MTPKLRIIFRRKYAAEFVDYAAFDLTCVKPHASTLL
jgi:hypothetical protein